MQNIDKWISRQIKHQTIKLVVGLFLVFLPLTYLTLVQLKKYELNSVIQTNQNALVTAIQTGDLVSIEKALFSFKNDKTINTIILVDKENSVLFQKLPLNTNSILKFEIERNLLSTNLDIWGKIKIDYQLNNFVIFWAYSILVIFTFIMYFSLKSRFLYSTKHLVTEISTLVDQVERSSPSNLVHEIDELSTIYKKIESLNYYTDLSLQLKNEINEQKILNNLSKKVAHDIRSPLSTLNLLSGKIEDLEIRKLFEMVSNQINLIAEDVLTKNRNINHTSPSFKITYKDFFLLIKKEYLSKAKLHKRSIDFIFENNFLNSDVNFRYSKILYPIICNCIQNSIEATNELNSEIKVSFGITPTKTTIVVSDNGIGIPSEVLVKLGKIEFSTKSDREKNNLFSGNGIAILNAKLDLNKINGDLSISSIVNQGTSVKLELPHP